ncbi:MAG: quinol:electron acceptor oxidoreductase subunit ActD [Planctomycetota bacterium]
MSNGRITHGSSDEPSWIKDLTAHDEESEQVLHAVVGEYATPDELLHACEQVRDAGFRDWDAITPFPIHGIEESMGVKKTILPWIVLGAALSGTTTALLLQWFTNAYDYPFVISGKPFFSLPANIPVTFELTVLFAVFTGFFAMLGLNLLPALYNPLFRHPRMKRFSSDRFAIVVESGDSLFERERVEKLLRSSGAVGVEPLFRPARRAGLPKTFYGVGLVAAVASLLPLAMIAKARFTTTEKTRIHIIQDMDMQPKFKAQAPNRLLGALWNDPRASIAPVDGTVARGEYVEDEAFQYGLDDEGAFVKQFPVTVDEHLLARGEERFAIFCSVCHGLSGDGNGQVNQRAKALAVSGGRGMAWAPPAKLFEQRIVDLPVGEIFNTVTNGKNNMKGYAAQIPVEDRWAIVAYVRVLQKAANVPVGQLPQDVRQELESQPVEGEANK